MGSCWPVLITKKRLAGPKKAGSFISKWHYYHNLKPPTTPQGIFETTKLRRPPESLVLCAFARRAGGLARAGWPWQAPFTVDAAAGVFVAARVSRLFCSSRARVAARASGRRGRMRKRAARASGRAARVGGASGRRELAARAGGVSGRELNRVALPVDMGGGQIGAPSPSPLSTFTIATSARGKENEHMRERACERRARERRARERRARERCERAARACGARVRRVRRERAARAARRTV